MASEPSHLAGLKVYGKDIDVGGLDWRPDVRSFSASATKSPEFAHGNGILIDEDGIPLAIRIDI